MQRFPGTWQDSQLPRPWEPKQKRGERPEDESQEESGASRWLGIRSVAIARHVYVYAEECKLFLVIMRRGALHDNRPGAGGGLRGRGRPGERWKARPGEAHKPRREIRKSPQLLLIGDKRSIQQQSIWSIKFGPWALGQQRRRGGAGEAAGGRPGPRREAAMG